jgi:membrane protein DedA with SNARE-associated domain
MPAIRTVISLPAGIAKMDIRKFITYTFIGSVPWNVFLAYLGWLLGENWAVIEKYAKILDYIVVISLLLLIVGYIIYKRREGIMRRLEKGEHSRGNKYLGA